MARKGLLVVIEGINGAGKSTIIDALVEHYRDEYISLSVYKFPNRNGCSGDRIDRYLKGRLSIESTYDVLDMFARNREFSRAQINADLKNGTLVICDRYVFSAIAYHIPLHVSDPQAITNYCKVIGYFDKKMPVPDVTYIINGNHLVKRGIIGRERFHYHGSKADQLTNLLRTVATHYTTNCVIINNGNGYLNVALHVILTDIRRRSCSTWSLA